MRTEQEELSHQYSDIKVRYHELKRNTGDYAELVKKHEVLKDVHKKLQNAYNQKKQICENLHKENERLSKALKEARQTPMVEQNPTEAPSKKRNKQLEKYANLYGESVRANDRLREEIRQLKLQIKQ